MADKKKNFYAVVKGRKAGIYNRWSGVGGAEEQIKGFPGAVFRGFVTRTEAENFLRTGAVIPATRLFEEKPDQPKPIPSVSRQTSASSQMADYHSDLADGKVVIFTDGASTGNPGPGGYGVVLLSGEERKELSGGFRCTTNNRMELLGVITALNALNRRMQAVVYSDSRYVVDAVEKGWARRWRTRGWMRDSVNAAENADLWAQLLDLLDRCPVEFRWVRGHADNPENERCDRLAVQAAHQAHLPADSGYKGNC
jgi:ribonuclease HI